MPHAQRLALAAMLACCGAAAAQPAVNGRLKPEYGPVRWVNTTPTGFGDNAPCIPFATGLRAALNNSNRAGIVGGPAPWAPATPAEQTAAAAVTTGAEFKVPLSEIGNPATIRIAGLITSSNYGEASNQFIGGLGGQSSAVAGNNYPGSKIVDLSVVPGNQFVTAPAPTTAAAEPAIDGTLDAAFYGAPLFVQDTRTNYGDASGPTDNALRAEVGSELDAVYARVATVGGVTSLYVFVAGNIQADNSGGSFKKLALFLDTGAPNGQNQLRDDNNAPIIDGGPNALGGPGTGATPGLKFDAGFSANYFLSLTAGDPNTGALTTFADFAKIGSAAQGGVARFLGSSTTTAPIVPVDTCPNDATRRDFASGSEIDGVYTMVCGDFLYVLVTGNLQTNGDRIDLFFDGGTVNRPDQGPSVGQNRLGNANVPIDSSAANPTGSLNRMGPDPVNATAAPGLRFSQGFNADYWVSARTSPGSAGLELLGWAATLNSCTPFTCANTTGGAPPQYLEYGSFVVVPKTASPLSFDGTTCVRFGANGACAPANGQTSAWNPGNVPGIDIQGDPLGTANTLTVIDEPVTSFAPRLVSRDVFNPFGVTVPNFGAPAHGNLAIPGLLSLYIDNSNTGGVTSSDASKASRVTTGLEIKIRRDELGWDGASPIRLTGFIISNDHTIMSNQVVGGTLPAAQANFAEPRAVDFQSVAGGPFWVDVVPGSCATAPTGACCFTGGDCVIVSAVQCAAIAGAYATDGTTCTATACSTPATIRCCRGSTCAVITTACTAPGGNTRAGAASAGAGASCNAPGARTPCCLADYNKVNNVDLLDIFAFLEDWFAGSPFTNHNGDANAGGDLLDIFSFLGDWFAGPC